VKIGHEVVGYGPPLVLLNGIMTTMQSRALMTPRLVSSYRVVLHDFRGIDGEAGDERR
jgi:pimeloyl-ACP methyl ester carboxylesterase